MRLTLLFKDFKDIHSFLQHKYSIASSVSFGSYIRSLHDIRPSPNCIYRSSFRTVGYRSQASLQSSAELFAYSPGCALDLRLSALWICDCRRAGSAAVRLRCSCAAAPAPHRGCAPLRFASRRHSKTPHCGFPARLNSAAPCRRQFTSVGELLLCDLREVTWPEAGPRRPIRSFT